MSTHTIEELILDWRDEACSYNPAQYMIVSGVLYIFTKDHMQFLGEHGMLYYKYRCKIMREFDDIIHIRLVEVNSIKQEKIVRLDNLEGM